MSLRKNIEFSNNVAEKIRKTENPQIFFAYLMILAGINVKQRQQIMNDVSLLRYYAIAFVTKNTLRHENLEIPEFYGDVAANFAVTNFIRDYFDEEDIFSDKTDKRQFDHITKLETIDTLANFLKSKEVFATFAKFLSFGKFILNVGINNKMSDSILEDTFEAVIHAIYMSTDDGYGGGFRYVQNFVYNLLNKFDYKSKLNTKEDILLLDPITLVKNMFIDKFTKSFIDMNSTPFEVAKKNKTFNIVYRIEVTSPDDKSNKKYIKFNLPMSKDTKQNSAKKQAARKFYDKYIRDKENYLEDLIRDFQIPDIFMKKISEIDDISGVDKQIEQQKEPQQEAYQVQDFDQLEDDIYQKQPSILQSNLNLLSGDDEKSNVMYTQQELSHFIQPDFDDNTQNDGQYGDDFDDDFGGDDFDNNGERYGDFDDFIN
jgi:dsRNA-specific ribonuclease